MSPEQPTKTICEICGGAHPTSAHIDTRDNLQEKERTREEEPNREAITKVVDLLATEDLKYRAYDPIITTLETGIPTPLTDFLYQPFGRLDETAKEEMRHSAETLAQTRKKGDVEEKRRQQANVFYPEGLLKVLRDQVLGTKNVELWSENDLKEAARFGVGLSFAIGQLGRAFRSLQEQEQTKIAQLIGHTAPQIVDVLVNDPRYYLPHINFDEEKELKEILEPLLNNSIAFEIIRSAWLKIFFSDTSKHESRRSLTPHGYTPKYGLVLSSQTDVAVSPHGDFPTQATILSPRVKPKDFIGFFVNTDHSSWQDFVTDEAIELDFDKNTFVKELPPQKQLEHAIFRTPEQPIEYLFAHYARPFLLFLEQQDLERGNLKTYFHHFSSIWDEESKRESIGSSLDKRAERKESYLKREKNVGDKLRTELTEETYKELEALAKKFIDEKSSVKDGETLWTGLIRLAEQHQLPVYNLRGELLWPEHMTHEQVAQFVASKNTDEKE